MKVTAETITDEQIRHLRSVLIKESGNQCTSDTEATGMALSDPDQCSLSIRGDAKIIRAIAREQCAALWNARHGEKP